MKISVNWVNDYVDTKDINTEVLVKILKDNKFMIKDIIDLKEDRLLEFDEVCCHYEAAKIIGAVTGREINNIEYVDEAYLRYSSSCLLINEVKNHKSFIRYSAIKIENASYESSPAHIADRLLNCGHKYTNLIEDLAVYVSLDIGQKVNIVPKPGSVIIEAAVERGEAKDTVSSIIAVCRYIRLLQEYMPEARVSSALYDVMSA